MILLIKSVLSKLTVSASFLRYCQLYHAIFFLWLFFFPCNIHIYTYTMYNMYIHIYTYIYKYICIYIYIYQTKASVWWIDNEILEAGSSNFSCYEGNYDTMHKLFIHSSNFNICKERLIRNFKQESIKVSQFC